ncbi:HIT family protein [Roseateles koreensis]|uniref:HIT family protein n=1 Tax=Roseateles koreensis TaxID=2987526 RepID=A0ABT5KM82_9BURK|nr:HIT family protein [Roseateles koreensis]MDC8784022.1 HIT family protein [Roseateles koreensis]
MTLSHAACPLCRDSGGRLVVQTPLWRVVRVEDDANFPAFYRLIWQDHVAEFSTLTPAERTVCMEAVAAIERVLLAQLRPTKVNLASLGNVVPHLHWHVIARFEWDSHFPNPIWGARQREVSGEAAARLAVPLTELDQHVIAALAGVHA